MARPCTPIRQAMRTSAREMLACRPHVTSRDLLACGISAGASRDMARNALREMVRTGELRRVTTVRGAGSCRPLSAYALPTPETDLPLWASLAHAITGPAMAAGTTC